MKPSGYLVLFFTFLVFFGVGRKVWAGGDPHEHLDPLNGCFEKPESAGNTRAEANADFINFRHKYRKIIDDMRFAKHSQCWNGEAYCIKLATVCRKDGKVVYDGFDWMVRQK